MASPAITEALQPSRTQALWEVRETVARIEQGVSTVLAEVREGKATRAQMNALAEVFGIQDPEDWSDRKLHELLMDKGQEYQALKTQIENINPAHTTLANLRKSAEGALEDGNWDEAIRLLGLDREVSLEETANATELIAQAELTRGNVEEAYRQLSFAADIFAIVDALEPVRRRLRYDEMLYANGLRFGGTGISLAAKMNRDAVDKLDKEAQPQLWGNAQNNLGVALQDQGIRTAGPEGAELLAQAVTAYRTALTVYTQADHPVDWAMTQENLAIAEEAIANHDTTPDPRPHLEAALRHVEDALTVYDPEHMSYDHAKATRVRDRMRAALEAL